MPYQSANPATGEILVMGDAHGECSPIGMSIGIHALNSAASESYNATILPTGIRSRFINNVNGRELGTGCSKNSPRK
jgi:hypothetical protein